MVKSRTIIWAEHVARLEVGEEEEEKTANRLLVGKPEGKRSLRKLRRRWVNNIQMDLKGIGLDGTDWIHLVQNMDQLRALVNTIMNLWIP
jgi:hypothetical protein